MRIRAPGRSFVERLYDVRVRHTFRHQPPLFFRLLLTVSSLLSAIAVSEYFECRYFAMVKRLDIPLHIRPEVLFAPPNGTHYVNGVRLP